MKVTILNLLLGTTLLLAPWLISRLAQGGITDLFHVGALPSVQENVNVKVSAESKLTCDDFDSCPEDSSLVANPFLVPCGHKCHKETCCLINNRGDEVQEASTTDESSLTCDDFASCPQGWSLVASPSLVVCSGTCEKETCCLDDAATEVLQDKANPRRLDPSNDTTTETTTTTATTTTTVYEPQPNTTNATTGTTTATTTTTVTTTITETATETVTATLTERGDRETVLSGYIILTIPNAQAFMDDTKAVDAFKEAVAETVSVPTSWVDLVFHLGLKRRLSDTDGGAHLRRLQSNKLTVDYTITIPGSAEKPTTGLGSDVNAASINTALVTEIYSGFTSKLEAKLIAAGVTAGTYSIVTEKINAPIITLKTITTTTTITNPDLEDDSLAFTRVPLSLAHALALLAVSASALSF
mmetsp:Transcript_109750/g.224250  ORF Transcript_109750/g.224250 Transcript_109750/m.224250 type:complete len:414 (+) Transcript_109750:92-1333(+)